MNTITTDFSYIALGDRLVFRFGEIEDDALVSLFDGHAQTAALFCANSSTGVAL